MSIVEHEPQVETPTLTEYGDVYLRAADIIREKGWWQDTRPETANGRCLMLAIGDAANELRRSLGGAQTDFCHRMGFDGYFDGTAWNDDSRRKEWEVLNALERAAYGL